jgi:sugar lactone lactonase YvrE
MRFLSPLPLLLFLGAAVFAAPETPEQLFTATPLTPEGSFTSGVEGPATDAAGNVYAVNFQQQHTIGKISMDGKGEVFTTLPGKSVGNGIRFDSAVRMLVADYAGHNIFRIDMRTKAATIFAHDDRFHQPNDLAIAPDDTLYASDPDWATTTGQVWRIDRDGKVSLAAGDLGTANGIEVSPDGRTLYVNETIQRNIWAFPIQADGTLGEKRLLKKFEDFGFDGMRCDIDGNLYVTRNGKGTVVKLSPAGEILHEIDVLGSGPTNICLAGPDGRTAVVTEAKTKRLIQFRIDRPGAEWQRAQRK